MVAPTLPDGGLPGGWAARRFDAAALVICVPCFKLRASREKRSENVCAAFFGQQRRRLMTNAIKTERMLAQYIIRARAAACGAAERRKLSGARNN